MGLAGKHSLPVTRYIHILEIHTVQNALHDRTCICQIVIFKLTNNINVFIKLQCAC